MYTQYTYIYGLPVPLSPIIMEVRKDELSLHGHFSTCMTVEGRGHKSPTPLRTDMEPQNCWFVDVSPFPKALYLVPY